MTLGWIDDSGMVDAVLCNCNRCGRDFYAEYPVAMEFMDYDLNDDVCPYCEHGSFEPYIDCECCGNAHLASELDRGLCRECYPDFYPDEAVVERRFGKIVDIMLAKAGRRTSYANQEAI